MKSEVKGALGIIQSAVNEKIKDENELVVISACLTIFEAFLEAQERQTAAIESLAESNARLVEMAAPGYARADSAAR